MWLAFNPLLLLLYGRFGVVRVDAKKVKSDSNLGCLVCLHSSKTVRKWGNWADVTWRDRGVKRLKTVFMSSQGISKGGVKASRCLSPPIHQEEATGSRASFTPLWCEHRGQHGLTESSWRISWERKKRALRTSGERFRQVHVQLSGGDWWAQLERQDC